MNKLGNYQCREFTVISGMMWKRVWNSANSSSLPSARPSSSYTRRTPARTRSKSNARPSFTYSAYSFSAISIMSSLFSGLICPPPFRHPLCFTTPSLAHLGHAITSTTSYAHFRRYF